jgi:hypothetical protein
VRCPAIVKPLAAAALLAATLTAAAGGGAWLFTQRIGPGQVGVRQNDWTRKIESVDWGLGLHLRVPFVHTWHVLDARGHMLQFGHFGPSAARAPLDLRTGDDNTVRLDVVVLWRLRADAAHLAVEEGLANGLESRLGAAAEDVLRAGLGGLTTEEWFDVERRGAAARALLPALREQAARFHVEVEDLLVRGVAFAGDLERKLQDQQIEFQRDLLAVAQGKVDAGRSELARLAAETEAEEKTILAQWEVEKQTLARAADLALLETRTQAELYDKATRAAADEAHARASALQQRALDEITSRAERERLALLDSDGGRILLARQAAENLAVQHVTLDPRDPGVPSLLDLDELARLLVGGAPAGATREP